MLKSRSGSSPSSGNIFNGVRFVLFGFDSVSEAQYRSEIVGRGGTDVGKYDDTCTHVIVSGRVYDDPVCIAARQDGKVLVTELWIDDSVDFGTLVDASRIIYRPVKDLNGIPGSESLYICLTGYQRQERDDIMKMVSLMGARFSKPLIANQATHLICYKFEGEKYELAKKVKIKLVNHRWLEDCLKEWEILPIDNYTRSGWELEVLEAEARDSEEETEDPGMALLGQRSTGGPSHLRGEMPVPASSQVDTFNKGMSDIHQETPSAKLSNTAGGPPTNQKLFPTPCNEMNVRDAIRKENLDTNVEIGHQEAISTAQTGGDQNQDAVEVGELSILPDVLNPKMGSTSSGSDERCGTLSYLKKTTKKEFVTSNLCREGLEENISNGDPDISPEEARTNCEPDDFQNQTNSSVLPQKRKVSDLSTTSQSIRLEGQELKLSSRSPFRNMGFVQLEPTSASSVNHGQANASSPFGGVAKTSSNDNQHAAPSKFKSLSYRRSLKRSQPTQSNLSKGSDSPAIGSAHDAHPRAVLCQTMDVENKLPISKTKDSDVIISPTDDMVLRGLPSDTEPKKAMDVGGSLEKRPSGSYGMVIDGINKETRTRKFVSEPEMVSKAKSGVDTVMTDLSKVIVDEPGQLEGSEQHKEAPSPHGRDSEAKKLSSTASISACQETVNNESSAVHIKKLVSRRNLSCKTIVNARKDKGVNSLDKGATLKKTENMSGKFEKLKTKIEIERASNNEKKEAVESVSKDMVLEDKKVKEHLSGSSTKRNAVDRMKGSVDLEKENRPKENGILNVNSPNSKVHSKGSKKNSGQETKTIRMKSSGDKTSTLAALVDPEPVWFILSGHRFQRKEFQAMIRRLRGRVCRDSHSWSYQATHFIVPDPVRRTEKFFAAAAAGRWILKTDYLTASNEAGKFLDEEPFEWYKKGLTEDGAISLEAPRKWRHLRERTGHGAFHRMRIIIYGECIAPSLDTLKRVVKAGDGTILATSPPYTRFLKTGVDFAIVSASMPRVDSWVQEFLRHEIPCVVADYLVEYVCKPGYPLDRHVLYNTNSLAEKSFANLSSRLEVVEESNDDVKCSVCALGDREEVMLICGDENGSVGCGIGMHIDCCDPRMDAVPEGDWFCPKCNNDSMPKTPLKRSKKKSSAKVK